MVWDHNCIFIVNSFNWVLHVLCIHANAIVLDGVYTVNQCNSIVGCTMHFWQQLVEMKGRQGDTFLHVIGSEFQCSFWWKAIVAYVLERIHLTQKARQLEDVLLLRDISWSSENTGRANMSSDLKERQGDEQGIFILICNLYKHIYICIFFDSLRIFVLELSAVREDVADLLSSGKNLEAVTQRSGWKKIV